MVRLDGIGSDVRAIANAQYVADLKSRRYYVDCGCPTSAATPPP